MNKLHRTAKRLLAIPKLHGIAWTRLLTSDVALEPGKQSKQALVDGYGRKHDYLRISLTERCNLRCTYCMPEEGVQLTPKDHLLSTNEIIHLARLFVTRFGTRKIRLTGGEPLVRKDIVQVVSRLAQLKSSGLETLSMTTNGIVLHKHCHDLRSAGLDSVNISLDTLDEKRFELMARRRGLRHVLRSIETALGESFEAVKLNCVPIQGLNDCEVLDFVELARNTSLEVRFIEYMPFHGNRWHHDKMVSMAQLLSQIRDRYPKLQQMPPRSLNETAIVYRIDGFRGQIGLIASMTNAFCGGCNRVRLTADGHLKVCLFGRQEVSLKEALVQGQSDDHIARLVQLAVANKAKHHAGATNIAKASNRAMVLIATRQMSTGPPILTHVDPETGKARMVNIANKSTTARQALARACVHVGAKVMESINSKSITKGDVLTVAKIAGIQAAKSTSSLIPLCHQVALVGVELDFRLTESEIIIECRASASDRTGVEMEALVGASIAALTIYDMCKAVHKSIIIREVRLLSKSGGQTGDFQSSS